MLIHTAHLGPSYTLTLRSLHQRETETLPKSWWLPDSGTQRGSAISETGPGDPLTPGFPSVDGIYRQPLNESGLPPIPAFALSYGDAKEILNRMKG